ncbi:prolyl aminopeptidase [Microlunatus sp. Y2014]|uniref:prolyl aminopeptidase n=1 Tax=Microlunatus sp. Y2014 TaxID=3418488 RepID=UPI003DA6EE57
MHPPIEPHTHGLLERPEGNQIYWEASGNPEGRPAVYLHGGPGSGLGSGGYRRLFDPDVYLIIGLDQRGCGRSQPWAIDALDSLDTNTTSVLIGDVEALREHLGIERWLVAGGSWGSTLTLAYALAHHHRVTEIVLGAVTTGARAELDWITEGVGMMFPEAWERFAAARRPGERVVQAYARLLRDTDPAVRTAAAEAWDAWESTHVSLDPNHQPGPNRKDPRDRVNFATLVTHFWANDCFLGGQRVVLDRAGELAEIPGVLVHGRHDVSSPARAAWELHHAWPGSELIIVETEGHVGPKMLEIQATAINRFAGRTSQNETVRRRFTEPTATR